jgi:hypothetical protein
MKKLIVKKKEEIIKRIKKYAVRPGLEPGQAEPKSTVLPLHHRTVLIRTHK